MPIIQLWCPHCHQTVGTLNMRETAPPKLPPLEIAPEVLAQPIEHLRMSIRTANCLTAEGLRTVGAIIAKSEAELLRVPNMGRKSVNEIKAVVQELGLHLGMELPE